MLLAVEGGGFFSSSASGYSKGLALLLLGQQRKEEKQQMRVSPWNQYQLVDEDEEGVRSETSTFATFQLASKKNKFSRRCASLICFGGASSSSGTDGQRSSFEVGSVMKPEDDKTINEGAAKVVGRRNEEVSVKNDEIDYNFRNVSLKSSLKKRSRPHNVPISIKAAVENDRLDEQRQQGDGDAGFMERRKVQWTDACGKELAEIREFEVSEAGGSDDESENRNAKTCSCMIM